MICDYCNTENIEKHYKAKTTLRDIDICVCNECNLIQSWPRLSGIYGRAISTSGGADWGNVRYGKLMYLNRTLKFIEQYISFNKCKNFLDIGANRGAFVKFIKKKYPDKAVTGIENDKIIFDEELKNIKDARMINEKFENVFFKEKFDFIYCCHTLEHLVSASKAMEKIREIINENGILYLEVPNVDAIESKECIAEFFIDKHLFHFSQQTLEAYIEAYNFEIISKEILPTYLCYLLNPSKKNDKKKIHFNKNPEIFTKIKKYYHRLNNWTGAIPVFNNNAKQICNKGSLAIWGMGRIFDQLWKNKAFENVKIDLFLDKNLSEFIETLKGAKIDKPDKLKKTNIKNIIVCSDVFFEEIKNEIEQISKDINVFQYKSLLKKCD